MSGRSVERLRIFTRGVWDLLRAWSGDSAYETYLARAVEGPRLGRRDFYLDSLRRRYRGPNRCC